MSIEKLNGIVYPNFRFANRELCYYFNIHYNSHNAEKTTSASAGWEL